MKCHTYCRKCSAVAHKLKQMPAAHTQTAMGKKQPLGRAWQVGWWGKVGKEGGKGGRWQVVEICLNRGELTPICPVPGKQEPASPWCVLPRTKHVHATTRRRGGSAGAAVAGECRPPRCCYVFTCRHVQMPQLRRWGSARNIIRRRAPTHTISRTRTSSSGGAQNKRPRAPEGWRVICRESMRAPTNHVAVFTRLHARHALRGAGVREKPEPRCASCMLSPPLLLLRHRKNRYTYCLTRVESARQNARRAVAQNVHARFRRHVVKPRAALRCRQQNGTTISKSVPVAFVDNVAATCARAIMPSK